MNSLILHGRRLCEFQKWRSLIVNASSFSSPFSSATTLDLSFRDDRKVKTFTVSYLVDSLGLTAKLAESISRKVSFEEKGNPDSVLGLLRTYDFTNSQISTIVTAYPRLLTLNAEESIGPKLQFLKSRGASTSELTEIVSQVPRLLGVRYEKAISRYYDFAKEIIEADKSFKFEKLCHSLSQGSRQENVVRNILVLRELGVPLKRLFPMLISKSSLSGKENFEESVQKVVEMGFNPSNAKFVLALLVVRGSSGKTIEEKMQVYERLGLAVGDVWKMFKKFPTTLALSKRTIENSIETFIGLGFTRDEFAMMVKRHPHCIGFSAESVKKKTEFLVKKMNWPLKAVASQPTVFGCSLEKRIVPRCNVIKALMSKGLIRSELPSLSSVLMPTDQAFLNKYVMKHDDKRLEPELIAIFTRDCVSLTDHLEQ